VSAALACGGQAGAQSAPLKKVQESGAIAMRTGLMHQSLPAQVGLADIDEGLEFGDRGSASEG
jgi:hypothetical protein